MIRIKSYSHKAHPLICPNQTNLNVSVLIQGIFTHHTIM